MIRTQLYLEDDLWTTLHALARAQKTTVSGLVRVAVREHYLGHREQRMKAMQEFAALRESVPEDVAGTDSVDYIRNLRRSSRLERLDAE